MRPTKSMRGFWKIQPATFTPPDSPSRSPETVAIEMLHEYTKDIRNSFKPYPPMNLAMFMRLTHAINTLLCEHIIGPTLAFMIAGHVADRFAESGRK